MIKSIVATLCAITTLFISMTASGADTDWEVIGEDNGILVERRNLADSDLVEFRGETVIEASVPKIAQVLSDTARKLEWIDRIHTAKDIAVISPMERIEYNRSKAPWPVKDRDFVYKVNATVDLAKKQVKVAIRSVKHSDMPEQSCCVRGELLNSSYVLQALGDGSQTKVQVQIHADPKGAVPTWIVNLIQKSWPRKTLEQLKLQVAKPDVAENAYYKELFDRAYGRTESLKSSTVTL